ncbi:MAG: tRNA uridine-5-carboxymethylaminomethyl(34) synthesis GTPase MnmE, partial [Methyloligellaceae bacterium]
MTQEPTLQDSTDQDPTIFALSSAPGRAGVAVIRISGNQCRTVMDTVCGAELEPRVARLCELRDPDTGDAVDKALCLWFPGPHSFTGEDSLELHCHGSRAVIARLIDTLSGLDNCRLAEPGEFSRRAFENGKIDLTAAEGLEDLINAETEEQRRQALGQAQGRLGNLYESWRSQLISALALMEAGLDFSDEEDVPAAVLAEALPLVEDLRDQLQRHLADAHKGEILREGFRVVLAGPPNAGKSSLLNALARRDVAIVSDEAGTTRDVLEVILDLKGVPVILTDTAGIRETCAPVEQEGIRRARDRVRQADLVLWLMDISDRDQPDPPDPASDSEFGPEFGRDNILHLHTKTDLVSPAQAKDRIDSIPGSLGLSVKSGDGLDALIEIMADRAFMAIDRGEEPLITRQRHRDRIVQSHEALGRFVDCDKADPELRAEDLRTAAQALGRITGRVDVEDILDRIFSSFCIG